MCYNTHMIKTIITLLLSISLVSCGSPKTYTYSKCIQTELDKIEKLFLDNGVEYDILLDDKVRTIVLVSQSTLRADYVAADTNKGVIRVSYLMWDEYTERRQRLLLHELGHTLCKLEHSGAGSVMHYSILSGLSEDAIDIYIDKIKECVKGREHGVKE
jgi:hypothetical protein